MQLICIDDVCNSIEVILIYLNYKCNSNKGNFVDIHPKTYQITVAYSIDDTITYDGINFTMQRKGNYMAVNGSIQQYRELILDGDKDKIDEFCKNAFKFNDNKINNNKIANKLNIFTFHHFWCFLESSDYKSLESINLPKKQLDSVLNDIKYFISDEVCSKYKKLNIAHTRNYMFYGPPGTGKTTLIKGLASYIDYSIGIIDFNSELDDKKLKYALMKRPKKTILIFEDIDCLFESRKKSDTYSTHVTFSGLLNTIDGIVSHDNLIIIFTTNHLEILDFALKRRIDFFIKFEYATKLQIKYMFERFYPTQLNTFNTFYESIKHIKLTPNILQKFFTKHLEDNIIDYTDELCSFATGELAVESLDRFYT
uniref:AAA+ ATPase domain-containing protein n=1 Tax=viral metagenome TaxID=1070528 RepID=A0A6C0FDK4_9ZZZZ|tara:strand:+ start:15481 stop:16584 length:1104 start_codon:yes stop_codon:yes gene_type:complete